jgi:hypothetical protein
MPPRCHGSTGWQFSLIGTYVPRFPVRYSALNRRVGTGEREATHTFWHPVPARPKGEAVANASA